MFRQGDSPRAQLPRDCLIQRFVIDLRETAHVEDEGRNGRLFLPRRHIPGDFSRLPRGWPGIPGFSPGTAMTCGWSPRICPNCSSCSQSPAPPAAAVAAPAARPRPLTGSFRKRIFRVGPALERLRQPAKDLIEDRSQRQAERRVAELVFGRELDARAAAGSVVKRPPRTRSAGTGRRGRRCESSDARGRGCPGWLSAPGSTPVRLPFRRSGSRPPPVRRLDGGSAPPDRKGRISDSSRNRRPDRTCPQRHGGRGASRETMAFYVWARGTGVGRPGPQALYSLSLACKL